MFQPSDLSGSRPSSWFSLRLNPRASHKDSERSAHTHVHTRSAQTFVKTPRILVYTEFLFADFCPAGDEDRHGHSDVAVWEDGQRHQVLYQHTTGGWQRCWEKSVCCRSSSLKYSIITSQYVFCLHSSSTVAATSSWTQRPSSVSLWGRRTRTRACSICGRPSSSYSVQNGTVCPVCQTFWMLRPLSENSHIH